jgi:3-oxoacyl-[acyl-carrier protein] reductase
MLLRGRTVHVSGDGELADALRGHGAQLVGPEGEVDVVVHVVGGDLRERSLAETDVAQWSTRCDEPLAAAVVAAQSAHARLRRPGGRLVFVVPSLGHTGAAGLVPLATVAEGVRALAKSAARQWGAEGITVSCVARREAGPVVALASLPSPTTADVAATVALLASEQAAAITGATLVVDGGTVLVP